MKNEYSEYYRERERLNKYVTENLDDIDNIYLLFSGRNPEHELRYEKEKAREQQESIAIMY